MHRRDDASAPAFAAPAAGAALRRKAKAKIAILATGGTIAGAGDASGYGYKSGAFKVEDLIKAVPNLGELAQPERRAGRQHRQPGHERRGLAEAGQARQRAAAPRDVDGIVITHGTDTMEETAYFLNLVVKSDKPVVLVGSMRPATAISADGPATSTTPWRSPRTEAARGRGVLVVLNDEIHSARNVTKTDTTNVETFESPNRGPAGLRQHAGRSRGSSASRQEAHDQVGVLGRKRAQRCRASTSSTRTRT